MTQSPLSKKLGVKTGHKVLVMNGPDGYLEALGPLPLEVEVATASTGKFNIVQLFVRNKSEVDEHAAAAMAALEPAGLLWLTYPKWRSKMKTDISHDTGGLRS